MSLIHRDFEARLSVKAKLTNPPLPMRNRLPRFTRKLSVRERGNISVIHSKITDMERAYQEVIEFIAGGTTPENVVAFRPSQASKERVETLIQRKKNAELSQDESSKLEHYMQLEHLMRLAKARARHQSERN